MTEYREFRIRYKGEERSMVVRLIHAWRRDDPVIELGPVMSASSGVKDYVRNDACAIFARDPEIDAIYVVRGGDPGGGRGSA